MNIKLLYLTNIPTPYRQKRFNKMQEIFPKFDIDFEVLYMANIEADRNWIIPPDSYSYKYKVYKGIHPTINGFFAHFNPGLLIRLLKNDYDLIIIGGMASPTHWLAPFFVSKKKIQIMSVESNLDSVIRKTGFGARVKKILLNKADAYQITGNRQIEYIKYFLPNVGKRKFIKLPNLIDETVFKNDIKILRENKLILRKEFNVKEDCQMWVLPARLISIKGVLPFLELIKNIQGIKLYILGDGELLNDVKYYIKENNISAVTIGFVQQEEVIKYYAAADLFVLPSLKDPSPLSPIEAIAAGLPILVSSLIGNLEDVLSENVNGWSYNPITEKEKGREVIQHISSLTAESLSQMGKESINRYDLIFNTEKCIVRYAENLKKLT